MGMAASQARFLGLTARKTNVEYEGQQVNQQRTALANESAGLFNQMLTLKVPVPPSATDYYNMRYSYEVDNKTYEVLNYVANPTGGYTITVRTSSDVAKYTPNILINDDPTQIKQTLYLENDAQGKPSYYICFGSNTDKHLLTGPKENSELVNTINSDYEKKGITTKLDNNTQFYSYDRDGTQYYITAEEAAKANTTGCYDGVFTAHRLYMSKEVTNSTFDGNFVTDSTGQFKYITAADGAQYELAIDEVSDDAGYDKAMNDYNYEKMLYDKAIQDINAKTEKIQAQDRSLELRLKQLDTEQEALSKEMEAIKDVIQKNVETTFKTFA